MIEVLFNALDALECSSLSLSRDRHLADEFSHGVRGSRVAGAILMVHARRESYVCRTHRLLLLYGNR